MVYLLLDFNSKCVFIFIQITRCYFDDGYYGTNVYMLSHLQGGHVVTGPAIIVDQNR